MRISLVFNFFSLLFSLWLQDTLHFVYHIFLFWAASYISKIVCNLYNISNNTSLISHTIFYILHNISYLKQYLISQKMFYILNNISYLKQYFWLWIILKQTLSVQNPMWNRRVKNFTLMFYVDFASCPLLMFDILPVVSCC